MSNIPVLGHRRESIMACSRCSDADPELRAPFGSTSPEDKGSYSTLYKSTIVTGGNRPRRVNRDQLRGPEGASMPSSEPSLRI